MAFMWMPNELPVPIGIQYYALEENTKHTKQNAST